MTLAEFETNLKATGHPVYHLEAPKGATRFAVWNQYGISPILGDDGNQLNAPRVQIDIITNRYDDILVDDICAALWLMDIPYTTAGGGYDPDYNASRTILQMMVI